MSQKPIFIFIVFIGICAGIAHLLGVDLFVVMNTISNALTGGK